MSKVRVSKTIISDALDIAALDRHAWASNKDSEFIPDGEHAWRLWCEHSIMFTAKINDETVGAILAFYCENGVYCIHKVIVSSDHRGNGIGNLLFESLLTTLDIKKVSTSLTVDPNNKNAISLYSKWGFAAKALVNGYYRSYEDRLIMVREPH